MKIGDLVMHKTTGEIFEIEDIVGVWAEVSDIMNTKLLLTVKMDKLELLTEPEVEAKATTFANPTRPITAPPKGKENPNDNSTTN